MTSLLTRIHRALCRHDWIAAAWVVTGRAKDYDGWSRKCRKCGVMRSYER